MLSEVVDFASFLFWSATDHACAFVFNPHTFLLHFVIACLMYALHVDGAVKGRQLVAMAAAEELMVYALWLTVSHGLRSVFAIWVCLSIYDGIVRPTIQLQNNPFFVAGENFDHLLPVISRRLLGLKFHDCAAQPFKYRYQLCQHPAGHRLLCN
jgi:hypothetical protein